MKKINVYFIGECIIIVLLLAVIGLLISDRGTMSDGRIAQAQETAAQEQGAENYEVVVENDDKALGLRKITEVILGGATSEAGNDIVASEEEQELVMAPEIEEYSSVLDGKKIVVFGDSIWNDSRGEDGVSEQLMAMTGSTVYNCAIGGTSAALVGNNPDDIREWDNQSFNGMVYVANNVVSARQVMGDTEAYEVIEQVDFNAVDYILVSYGLNDFFSEVPVYPEAYYDINSYVGALRNGILHLREHYPQAQIVLVTPTYSQLFESEREYRIGDYVEAMRGVSVEMNTGLADMFHVMGEDADSRIEHLDDGVHLSAEGRTIYAQGIAWYLTEIENAKQQTQ
ncbi:MAG: SGNH/GDSL hydrolase family protein [Lachnospiraceae bacterium]|nr:SGNH/GDSL hydrolase family protein [Lachnospiraceae bacterium]